jgi:hypothetical protein
VPEVTSRVFLLCSGLAALAIVAALGRSLVVDLLALLLGICGVALVLISFARGR